MSSTTRPIFSEQRGASKDFRNSEMASTNKGIGALAFSSNYCLNGAEYGDCSMFMTDLKKNGSLGNSKILV